jgi:hypothetical protein
MRRANKVLLSALVLFSTLSFASAVTTLIKKDFARWPKADAKSFGCFLEKEFQYKDKKFNCGLKAYRNNGDPCKNTKKYYEGPQFPARKAHLVDSRIKSLDLTWEHGQLQNLAVTMNGKFAEKELRSRFNLPESASVQDCSSTDTCIILTGFDHLGAGEVDCGE